jgi:hypothetical protein
MSKTLSISLAPFCLLFLACPKAFVVKCAISGILSSLTAEHLEGINRVILSKAKNLLHRNGRSFTEFIDPLFPGFPANHTIPTMHLR